MMADEWLQLLSYLWYELGCAEFDKFKERERSLGLMLAHPTSVEMDQ